MLLVSPTSMDALKVLKSQNFVNAENKNLKLYPKSYGVPHLKKVRQPYGIN